MHNLGERLQQTADRSVEHTLKGFIDQATSKAVIKVIDQHPRIQELLAKIIETSLERPLKRLEPLSMTRLDTILSELKLRRWMLGYLIAATTTIL